MSTSKRSRKARGGRWEVEVPLFPRRSPPRTVALEVSEIEIILPYQLANQELNQNLRGSYRW